MNTTLLLAALSRNPYQGITRMVNGLYFTYEIEGEGVVASDSDIAAIEKNLSELAGHPVKLVVFVVPGFEAQEQLGLDPADALDVLHGAVEAGLIPTWTTSN